MFLTRAQPSSRTTDSFFDIGFPVEHYFDEALSKTITPAIDLYDDGKSLYDSDMILTFLSYHR